MTEETKDTQPTEVVELLSKLEAKFEPCKKTKEPYSRGWYLGVAFLLGQHWVRYRTKEQLLYTPPVPKWRVRLTCNLILPIVRIIIGKLNKIKMNLVVTPSTKENEDISAAKVGTRVLKYLGKKFKLVLKTMQLCLIILVFGNAFLKVFWDSEADEEFEMEEDVEIGIDNETGKKVYEKKKKTLHLGNIDCAVLTPLEIFPEPTATEINEARYIYETRIQNIDAVEDKYGIRVKSDSNLFLNPMHQQINFLLGRNQLAKAEDCCLVKEYWEKPNKRYRKGRHIVYTGSKELLADEEMKPTYKSYPFVKFDYLPSLLVFFQNALLVHLIPLQKEYNKSKSQIIEHKNLMAKGKWLIPEGCRVARNSFTSEPGEKIYYDERGGIPTQADIKPLPNFVFQNITGIKSDMWDVAGLHDVSHAKVPSGIRSGLAISYLQEQDDSQLSPTYSLFEESMSEFGHKALEIVKENYKEKRMITITGRGLIPDVLKFKGSDLRNNTDVGVEVGSQLPYSKVARQNFFMELWKLGILKDPEQMKKYLEFSTPEDIFQDEILDEANSKIENQEMAKEIAIEANDWDNHGVHLKIHNMFRKDVEFESTTNKSKEFFKIHIQAHQKYMDALMMKQMEIMERVKQQGQDSKGAAPKG